MVELREPGSVVLCDGVVLHRRQGPAASCARYSTIQNEGVHIGYRAGKTVTITFDYFGVTAPGSTVIRSNASSRFWCACARN